MNAATLTCSIIKIILSKIYNDNHAHGLDTFIFIQHFMDTIQRMKTEQSSCLTIEEKRNDKILIMSQLNQMIRSLLFVSLVMSTTSTCYHNKKSRSRPFPTNKLLTTPPLTPNSLDQPGDYDDDSNLNLFCYTTNNDEQHLIRRSEKNNTVGKRWIRHLSIFNNNEKDDDKERGEIEDLNNINCIQTVPLHELVSITDSATSFQRGKEELNTSKKLKQGKRYLNWLRINKRMKRLQESILQPFTLLLVEEQNKKRRESMMLFEDELLRYVVKEEKEVKEGSRIYISENGNHVLIMEIVSNYKLQIVAGTFEKLFQRLAVDDERPQDVDYIDTFILCHHFFTNPCELLENLMERFYLEATLLSPPQFKIRERCIQVKILNVILRWINLQFQDFMNYPILISRLKAFLMGNVLRAGFTIEADMIQREFNQQKSKLTQPYLCNSHITTTTGRKPSITPSFLSFTSSIQTTPSPPESPTSSTEASPPPPSSILFTLNSKDIAKYLTLADFYIFKSITVQDYLKLSKVKEVNSISLMTERANKLTQWIISEISLYTINSKRRRSMIHKMIEIAKYCLHWNNFHTCMIITMGLTQLKEFREEITKEGQDDHQPSISTRDMLAYKQLLKYLNVCHNMNYYRTALKKIVSSSIKIPCIPFFPIILKDLTFILEGNETKRKDGLINFTKFRILIQFIHTVLGYTTENYSFSTELNYFPFFKQCKIGPSSSTLDQLASLLEDQIYQEY
ncbi:ras guanine nucleotide exchange factor domain-containing protein [Cokeromyces recurvatus]|uniref:ras guanine nucleotide exchange factor domain-containing protein n=1 Tax=Cokeromyces recurvatus TaxID=90255 RepID=UPI00221FBB22|nr:ras guanine nucleotide exchange factor domain-containing protein [Cokeromyces recurvatus]KAI7905762.1 ras guanine nucleotide exchange factor domain-containing protein [Cokeromyces recurvatus]